MSIAFKHHQSSISLVEISGRFIGEKIRFENPDTGDVIIAEIQLAPPEDPTNETAPRGRISIKGQAEFQELIPGCEYRFYGKWTQYKNKRTRCTEKQFSFQSFVAVAPASREAIIAYLVNHGSGLGLGKARATKLYEAFLQDTIRIARTDPQRVHRELQKSGLHYDLNKAQCLARELQADEAVEAIKLDLTTLVTNRGFPKNIVNTVIQAWGNRAAQVIRRDPYRLMKFKGCGFKRCDSMWLDLGLNPTRMKRQAYCCWYAVASDTEGHTWFEDKVPAGFLRANIGGAGAGVDPAKALGLATRGRLLGKVNSVRNGGLIGNQEVGKLPPARVQTWYAEFHKARHERQIAEAILLAADEPHFWPSVDQLKLSDHQKEIAKKALIGSICVLGGSPGTGKTWTVSEIVLAAADVVGMDNILVGAPTGKAAVRVTENLTAKGIDLRARTWHSLLLALEMNKDHSPYFEHKVLIGDESSMLDTDLMAAIIRAKAAGAMLLLVGDVNQLPPVGHGAPLRDMIAAGVPYGELIEIVRNSGGIVETCAAIRDCKPWSAGDNLHLVDAREEGQHLERIKEIFRSAKEQGLDPVWDVQIVVAVNEKSPLSRKELNKQLQQYLNNQPGEEGRTFRAGDKVVNTNNGFFKSEKDEVYVANGELGKVLSVDAGQMTIQLDAPARTIQVRFGGEGGCTWDLGYALSVHKSQGSDWPWVVVVLDDYPGAKMVCDRSWLYTAISRAKERCWLVGQKSVASRMCRVSKIWHRKTFLRELILEGKAKRRLESV